MCYCAYSTFGLASVKSEEFIREVDEELQRDRLAALWKQYGAYGIAAALAIVLGTAGWTGWQAWSASALQQQGAAFDAAESKLAGGSHGEAADALAAVARDYPGGPALVAELRRAFALVEAGDQAAAVEALAAAAAGEGDPMLVDLARLQSLALQIDDADPAMLLRELEPLAAADRPWRYSARELRAAAAIRAGDPALARELLEGLESDAMTPPSLRVRAREVRATIAGAGEGS